jgi:hypothetical protein
MVNILFASVGCDVEKYIPLVKESYNEAKKCFDVVRYAIYENNSCDKTKVMLHEWAENDPSLQVVSEDLDIKNLCKARNIYNECSKIEIIALVRNKLLDIIEQEQYNNVDYVIMMDMNNPFPVPLYDIHKNIINFGRPFDALIAHVVNRNGNMATIQTYRDEEFPFGPEVMGEEFYMKHHVSRVSHHVACKDKPFRVLSCFNGLAIFNKTSIYNIRYNAYPTDNLDLMYRRSSDRFIQKTNYKKDGCPLGMFCFENVSLFYFNCHGFNFPLVNPHVTFFMDMIDKGFRDVFYVPSMKWLCE